MAPLDALQAALALALPPLQNTLTTTQGSSLVADRALVLPPLQAARIDVLRAAAAGDTLAQIEAALPAAATTGATRALLDGVSRQLSARASARFVPGFLQATDMGGSAAVPWASAITDWTAFGSTADLNLSAQTELVIGQRFDAIAPANGQATAFDGVGVRSPNYWYTAPMLSLSGPGGTLQGSDYTATATWVGDLLWVSLRPLGASPLYDGLPPASLASALLAVWAAYPAPEGLVSQSTQVWPQQSTTTLQDRSYLPAGITLPYDPVKANLSGLDGGGSYLTETARNASFTLDATGLRASGAQAMAFTFSAANLYGGSNYAAGFTAGSGSQNIDLSGAVAPPPCPRAAADWAGAYLALIDRSGRLRLIASLPDAGNMATDCQQTGS